MNKLKLNKKSHGFLKSSVRNINEEELKITHTVNTKALDRYNSVVLPKGADVKHFMNNAVVLWSHNGDEATPKIPVGRCVELEIREEEIVVTTEFNKNDPLAVKIFNAYKDGFLHAWSIGFMPKKYKVYDEENFEDLNKKYTLDISLEQVLEAENSYSPIFVVYQWELLEYSAVPVPGNPEALSIEGVRMYKEELVTRGLVDEKEVETIELKKEEPEAVVEEQVNEENSDNVEEVKKEENSDEDSLDKIEEDSPEEVADENAEAVEEEPSEVVEDEVEPVVEEEPSEVVEDEVEPVVEEVEEKDSNESTEDVVEDSDSISSEKVSEQNTNELEALTETVKSLSQSIQELSEKLIKSEEKINELSKINESLEEIKKSFDVDNIDKVREAAQKRKKSTSPDGFFKNFLSN